MCINIYHVWMGWTLTTIQLNRNQFHYGQFEIRYWNAMEIKKISYLKHYRGVWDGRWEWDLAFTTIILIECSFCALFQHSYRKNKQLLCCANRKIGEETSPMKFIIGELLQPTNIGKTSGALLMVFHMKCNVELHRAIWITFSFKLHKSYGLLIHGNHLMIIKLVL